MSNQIPKEKGIPDTWEVGTDNQSEGEKLELIEIKQDRGAKAFIYKDPQQVKKRESLWDKLWRDKAKRVE